jgi:hypothetical protein
MTEVVPAARQHEAVDRLASELRAIALDLLGLYDADELPPDNAAWVRTTIESAIAGICGPAISELARHLHARLAVAPVETLRKIEQAAFRHEAGYV